MKKLLVFLMAFVLLFSMAACSDSAPAADSTPADAPASAGSEAADSTVSGETLKIGLSMPTAAEERWVVDRDEIISYCEEQGIELVHAVADNDSNRQKEQVSTMITQGINVLIIGPNDGNAAAAIAEEAKENGIYVISYDRLITGTDLVDAYITFDSMQMGRINGSYIVEQLTEKYGEPKGNVVLLKGDPGDSSAPYYFGGAYEEMKPYIDSGAINVISENDCIGWKPEEATKHVENAMATADAQGITIDAILCPNDGTASGAIAALGDDLAKETIITGMDGEAAACKRILDGTQSMTSWGDTRLMARTSVDLAKQLFETGECEINSEKDSTDADGNAITVPAYSLEVVFIDEENIDLLIESGYHSEEDIYG